MSMQLASSVTSSSSVQSTGSATPRPVRRDRDGDDDQGRRVAGGRGRQQFFDAVSSALSALGLSLPAQQTPSGSQAATTATADTPAADNGAQAPNNVQQALHSFMHDLFKALKSQGGNQGGEEARSAENSQDDTNRVAQRGNEGYRNDLVSRVQDLVQKLSNSNGGDTKTDALQSSFSNLVQSLQPGSGTDASASTSTSAPAKALDLQAFLQNFLKNLQSGSAPVSPLGAAVNTIA